MEETIETQMESPNTTTATTTIAIEGFDNLITGHNELQGDGEEAGLQASSTQTTVTSDDVTIKKSNKVSYSCAFNLCTLAAVLVV